MSSAHEDEVQPEATEDDSQDIVVTEDPAPQVTDLQQYQLDRDI